MTKTVVAFDTVIKNIERGGNCSMMNGFRLSYFLVVDQTKIAWKKTTREYGLGTVQHM